MKKLILKTIIITLALIICLVFSLFVIFDIFSPSTLSSIGKSLNNKEMAVTYAEKAYNKNNNIENLGNLVDLSIWANDNEKTAKYGQYLLNHNDLQNYISQKNSNYIVNTVSNISIAFYYVDNKTTALDYALSYTTSYDKDIISPIIVLSLTAKQNGDNEMLNMVIQALQETGNSEAIELADIITQWRN